MRANPIAALDLHREAGPRFDPDEGSRSASLGLMLATGGDSRIWIDPYTGRNRYGVRTRPAGNEIAFASTTANPITPPGFARASRAFGALLRGETSPGHWLDGVRLEIASRLAIPGCQVVLAPSGTDAELIVLALVAGRTGRPITNIVIAPAETGSGVPMAAAGRHFLTTTALGAAVTPGLPVAGLGTGDIEVVPVAIRTADGTPRPAAEIDRDAEIAVMNALRRGRDVLLHVLDTAKTGLSGLSRATARALLLSAPEHVRIVVDACQLRCRPAQIRADLADGFIVIVTGSKFAGGPPFSGAILLPPTVHDEMLNGAALPVGLADYSAMQDWPVSLRGAVCSTLTSELNIGLGLRWEAALEGIGALASVGDATWDAILTSFAAGVRARAAPLRCLSPLIEVGGTTGPSSIVPLVVQHADGRPADMRHAQRMHEALRDEERGRVCHIGQTVTLGERNVLRVAIAAGELAAVARRMAEGQSQDDAFKPIAADLDALFAKWTEISRSLP